jgi:AraC family transcriptional regulator
MIVRPDMSAYGSYGQRIAESFSLNAPATLVTSTLRAAQLAVTRLTSSARGVGMTSPIAPEQAYLVNLQLRDVVHAELLKGNRLSAKGPMPQGSVTIVHLNEEPRFNLLSSFDSMLLYIPEIVFDELADVSGVPRITGFSSQYGTLDPIMRQLGCALLPALENARRPGKLFFDHLALAMFSHLATAYGEMGAGTKRTGRGLSRSQERLAKELLAADLTEEPSIAEIARVSGLPVGRFVRAFRQTTGVPPYRWLRGMRVERAQDLLFNSSLSLSQIAYECGFADQSHLTRVFAESIGITPGAWRRARRGSTRMSSAIRTSRDLSGVAGLAQ